MPELTEPQADAWAQPQISPLGEAETLVAAWTQDNRYYFGDPLHHAARADLVRRIANVLETALKQQEAPAKERPARRGKEKA